jgi:glycosyltransferase involved in cell wall biosynthesis
LAGAGPPVVESMSRPRVLMVQPSINPPGGGNAVACWILEALRTDYDLTLLTREEPDLALVNHVFGTSLTTADLRIVIAPVPVAALFTLVRPLATLALFRDHLLLTRARRMAGDFDAVVTAHNESDLGRRGMQFVHYPKLVAARPDTGLRWYQGPHAVAAYQAVCAVVTGFRSARMLSNVTLVNSEWTGQLVRARHGIDPITLYPPAAGPFPHVAWNNRRRAFVCVGRIAPEKRLEAVIEIIARVRRGHPDVTLHIAGNADDRGYLAQVQAAVRAHGNWVSLDLDLARDRLLHLMASYRYGIHGMRDEHFGMAVAELLCAGTIPFAHHSGGPIEILDGDRRLLYESDDDAVERIGRVIADDTLVEQLRASLTARATRFLSESFVRDVQRIVSGLVAEHRGGHHGA